MASARSGKSSADTTETAASPWDGALAELATPSGGLNIAVACTDRHVAAGRGGRVALRWLGRQQDRRDISFAELADQSGRAAQVLVDMGIGPGETVAVMLDRIPELYAAALVEAMERMKMLVPHSN